MMRVSGGFGSIREIHVSPPSLVVSISMGTASQGPACTSPNILARIAQAVSSFGKPKGKPPPGGGFTSSQVSPPSSVVENEVMPYPGSLSTFQPWSLSLTQISSNDQDSPASASQV